jgi:hypothetical protein
LSASVGSGLNRPTTESINALGPQRLDLGDPPLVLGDEPRVLIKGKRT